MVAEVLPIDEFGTQQCKTCGRILPLADFYRQPGGALGRKRHCKECQRATIYAWRDENPDRYLDQHLRRRFGISLEAYRALLVAQGGVCAICSEPPTWENSGRWASRYRGAKRPDSRLVVDHDHATGSVRGLLCGRCNTGIGFLQDDAAIVKSALNYLER